MDAPHVQNQHQDNERTRDIPQAFDTVQQEQEQISPPLLTQDSSIQDTGRPFTELLATLGHEFRTPLAAIKGYGSMLLRQEERLSPQERQEFLQAILQAGQRLEVLTERLLEMTNLETGTLELDKGPVNIPQLLQETILSAQKHVPGHLQERVTFHTHLREADGSPATAVPPVTGDRRRLRTVLEHLLENAIRFSPEGGRIDVILQPVFPAQVAHIPAQQANIPPFLEICVCDYGIGIPDEHLERIFERFHQVDTRLIREVNGLGLGLAICRQLISLHQGRIWAESCSAGGSAFHVWLPVA